jgi:hypothetical protein
MPVSPSTDNYYVGKGKISFKAAGESTFRDLGNVSSLEARPKSPRSNTSPPDPASG